MNDDINGDDSGTLALQDARALRELRAAMGEPELARAIGVASNTLTRAIALLPIRRGSRALFIQYLDRCTQNESLWK